MKRIVEMSDKESNATSTNHLSNNGKAVSGYFPSLIVLELKPGISEETVDWIISKLTSTKENGGADLLATYISNGECRDEEAYVIHVGISTEKLILVAELQQVRKTYVDGSLREFSMSDFSNFQNSGSGDLDDFFTLTEKQKLVQHEIESIRAGVTDFFIGGVPDIQLFKDQTIIPKCRQEGLIIQVYPLHNVAWLKKIRKEWYYHVTGSQPIKKVQQYFGETVAMYFSFLGFYTLALIPPAFVGFTSLFFGATSVKLMIFFSVFNIIWATLFLECWKQHSAVLAFDWGTINTDKFEEARSEYYGEIAKNPITGRLEPQYPKWKRQLKFYGVSVPIVIIFLFIAYLSMMYYFHWQDIADVFYYEDIESWTPFIVNFIPGIIYSLVVVIMNTIYRHVAHKLNDWENHRLQSAYDNHLILKLVLFDFFNCFVSLFYIAFWMKDMALLKSTLGSLLIVSQVVENCQEALLPYILYKCRKRDIRKKCIDRSSGEHPISDEVVLQSRIEGCKDAYVGTLDDYLELYLQFGYVFLFSSVFPSAALWALINNFLEIRSDAFKFCHLFQRPFAKSASGIGAWMLCFELMSILAIVTNSALIALSPDVQNMFPRYGEMETITIIVTIEHLLLFIKVFLSAIIPNKPNWVETALNRQTYEAKHAWSNEVRRQANMRKALGIDVKKPDYQEESKCNEDLGDKLMSTFSGFSDILADTIGKVPEIIDLKNEDKSSKMD